MIDLLLIPITGTLAGYAGGSLPFSYIFDKIKATWLPELLFAAALSFYAFTWYIAIPATAWVYIWMQTGHANALNWGKRADPTRRNTLTPVVDWLAGKLNITIFGRGYSALFFGVKGFLMGLPFGGVIPALLWALAYDIGVKVNKHWVSEVLSGALLASWVYLITILI